MNKNNNNFTSDDVDVNLENKTSKSQLYVTRDYSGVEVSIPIESKEKEEKQYFFNPDMLETKEVNSSCVEEKSEYKEKKKKKNLFWFLKRGKGHF